MATYGDTKWGLGLELTNARDLKEESWVDS